MSKCIRQAQEPFLFCHTESWLQWMNTSFFKEKHKNFQKKTKLSHNFWLQVPNLCLYYISCHKWSLQTKCWTWKLCWFIKQQKTTNTMLELVDNLHWIENRFKLNYVSDVWHQPSCDNGLHHSPRTNSNTLQNPAS